MRAIIYKRVSTQIQVQDGVSLDVQDERLTAYIVAQGWELVGTYEDAGLSGKDTNRPSYQQMMIDAEHKKFDCIVVYKLDRLTRSVRDFHDLSNQLDEFSVSIVSVTQNLDTSTAAGRLLRNILVDFANFEREMIVERTMDVKYNLAHKGQWLGGTPPYGYKNINKKLVIIPEQANIVKGIYEDYSKGYFTRQLMVKYGFKSHSPIVRILWNPIYTGLIGYSKTSRKTVNSTKKVKSIDDWILVQGEHEAIISKDLFDRVQDIKKTNTKSPGGHKSKEQVFENIVYCSCGKRMFYFCNTYKDKFYRFYRCNSSHTTVKGCGLSVKEDFIESRLLDKLTELTKNNKWNELKKMIKDNNKSENTNNIKSLESELSKNKTKISNLIDKMSTEDMQPIVKYLIEEVKKLEVRNITLLQQIEKQRIEDNKIVSFDETRTIIASISKYWEKSTREERREYAKILLKKLTVYQDKIKLEITDANIPELIC